MFLEKILALEKEKQKQDFDKMLEREKEEIQKILQNLEQNRLGKLKEN